MGLHVPIVERAIGMSDEPVAIGDILRFGIGGGVVAGLLLCIISWKFLPFLPEAFVTFGESFQPTLAARFLYGGITEEILMRFGLMTLIVFIASKAVKGTPDGVYWLGIVLAAIMFAMGHLPVAFVAVDSLTLGLFAYIMIGNIVGGLIFGWLYWKYGLESAFLGHIFAHVVMVSLEPLLS